MSFATLAFLFATALLLGAATLTAARQGRIPSIGAVLLGTAYVLLLGALIYLDPIDHLNVLWVLLAGVVAFFVFAVGWAITTRWRPTPQATPSSRVTLRDPD